MTFREIFDAHAPFVWRTLRRLGVSERDVEDVAQDVFVIVHRKLAELDLRSSVRAWIYGICIRIAADYRRSARVRREVVTDTVPDQGAPPRQHEELERDRARERLDAALAGLDRPKREIFVLYELEELPMSEIAQAVGCPLQTAYFRLHAARRELLASFGGEAAPAKKMPERTGARAPARLLSAGSLIGEHARSLLEAGRSEIPSATQLRELARLMEPLKGGPGLLDGASPGSAGPPPPGAPIFASASAAAGSSLLAPAIVSALIGGIVGISAVSIGRGGPEPGVHTAASAAQASRAEVPGKTSGARSASVLSGAEASNGDSAVTAERALPAGPAAETRTQEATPARSPFSPAERGGGAGGSARPEGVQASRVSPTKDSAGHGTELDLLRRAQAALSEDPSQALGVAAEHARLHPSGTLAQEREVIAITALVRLGRVAEAHARADGFYARYPSSAYRRRLEALLP